MDDETFQSVFQLLRVIPPPEIEKSLYAISILLPECSQEILQRVDTVPHVLLDAEAGRFFLCGDYNRKGDAFRSPWSNTYFPPSVIKMDESCSPEFHPVPQSAEDGRSSSCSTPQIEQERATVSPLREMEMNFNTIFDAYRDAYLNGGVSSVYVWPRHGDGFSAAFLLYKGILDESGSLKIIWSSTHVVEVTTSNALIVYKLLSSVYFRICTPLSDKDVSSSTDVAVALTEKKESQQRVTGARLAIASDHIQYADFNVFCYLDTFVQYQ